MSVVRWVAALGAATLAAASLTAVATAPAVAATPSVLAAYPSGAAHAPTSCPMSSTLSHQCTLSEALALVRPGGTIELMHGPLSVDDSFDGNWTVSTAGTSASAPVTISDDVASGSIFLSGDYGLNPGASGSVCSTKTCNGAILSVSAGVHLHITDVSLVAGAAQTGGSAINIGAGADVTLDGCSVLSNSGPDGAISLGNGTTGTLDLEASVLNDNSSTGNGGAVDSGENGGRSTVIVNDSQMIGNSAAGHGGAISSGTNLADTQLRITNSTFTGNSATGDGGAIATGYQNPRGATALISDTSLMQNLSSENGGAVSSGDHWDVSSTALTRVTSSSLWLNNAAVGPSIAAAYGESGLGDPAHNALQLAGDIISSPCLTLSGSYQDGGYNVGDDNCQAMGTGDVRDTNLSAELGYGPFGGDTYDIYPTSGPSIGAIPPATTITFTGAVRLALCPNVDERGASSAAGSACDAGAIQTQPPSLLGPDQTGWTYGSTTSFDVKALGDSVTLSESGTLPTGITFTDQGSGTGSFSGVPTDTGVFTVLMTATSPYGVAHEPITITVSPAGGFVALTPTRILDTRHAIGVTTTTSVPAHGTVRVHVDGVGGVPLSGAGSILANVTVVAAATSNGYVTVYPDHTTLPATSNINYSPNQVVANMAVSGVSSTGYVDFYNGGNGPVAIIADLYGLFTPGEPAGGEYVPLPAARRLLDTRSGVGARAGAVPAHGSVTFHVGGVDGLPSSLTGVVLNLTAVSPTASGTVTAYGGTSAAPAVTSLAFSPAHAATATLSIVDMDSVTSGEVTIKNNSAGSVQLIADASGYWSTTGGLGSYVPAAPARIFSGSVASRSSSNIADSAPASTTIATVTATAPTAPGFLTAYAAGTGGPPEVSAVNFAAGQGASNLVLINPLGSNNWELYNSAAASTPVTVDTFGTFDTQLPVG